MKKKSPPSSLRPNSRRSASVQARCCVVLGRWDHRQDCRRIEIGLARAGGPFDDTTRQLEAVQQLGKGAVTRLAHCFNGRRVGRAHLRQRDLGANESAVIEPSGMIGGIGMALMEHAVVDGRNGRVPNATLAEYAVSVHADAPTVMDVIFVEEHDPHVNPLGVKSIGELAQVGVPPAITNAIFHATGTRICDLPVTPDELL